MLNVEILEFRNAIQNFVKNSKLPEEVKRMIIEEILRKQELVSFEIMKQEITEREKLEQEESGNAESPQ